MLGASGTAVFLGRDREVAALADAIDEALQGTPQTIIVGGDAGIGKTTLVNQTSQRARGLGFAVAVGHCLDLEADISFAPVMEAVHALVSGVEDLGSRPSARRMLALLDPDRSGGAEPFRGLEDLRQVVLEAAAGGPVMLVLEDMHWADRSTQDFAVALSRTGRGRLLCVLTVRNDDLHRRHPARRTLAEISRVPGARRVDLGPLDRHDIAGIVAASSGQAPDPSLVRAVLARSEGNPLYAEELVDAGQHEIPRRLSDLFLARVDALGKDLPALLRLASISGTRIDTDTLPALAGLARERVSVMLREALEVHVLRQNGDSLEFRHGLLREAVYDDLLPDERTQLHADLAAILQTRADEDPDPGLSVLSRLAFHWSAAHDPPRTLASSVQAGLVASKVGAAEAVTHLERALSMYDRVPNAEALSGLTKVELVLTLARAFSDQGEAERWHSLSRRAVDMLEPSTDPLVASRAYAALGVSAMHDHDMPSAPEAIERAIAYAGSGPTEEGAYALAAHALLLNFNGHYAAGLDAANRAIQAARATPSTDPLFGALRFKSEALYYLGHPREAAVVAEQGVEEARSAGMTGQALHASGWLAPMLMDQGQVDRGKTIASAAYEEAVAAGLPFEAGWCGGPVAVALTWEGRLDAAEQLLEDLCALSPPDAPWRAQAELFLARGDADMTAEVIPAAALRDLAVGAYPHEADVLRELQLAALRDDGPRCHAVAEAYLRSLGDGDSPLLAAAAARIGVHALALNRSSTGPRVDHLRDMAMRLLGRARAGLTDEWRSTYHGVQLVLADGYAARFAGQPAVAQFQEASALAEPFGAFFALEPKLELAQDLLRHGRRDEGRELLVECWTAANDMGARGLEQRAFRLATRARVPLPETAAREGPLTRLTPREREVLDLLATGATNQSIASTLFISQKTVSTHVSNLLDKLGVQNRGSAVALARRLVV